MERKQLLLRIGALVLVLAAMLTAYGGVLYDLQIVKGEDYAQQSVRRITDTEAVAASRGSILDSYGRVGCTAAQLAAVDPADLLRVRRGSFGCEALVSDRGAFHKKYPKLMVEPIKLEDVMLFLGRGEEA